MNIEENIGHLVCRLNDLRDEYQTQCNQAQKALREYVISTQYPIADRFEVWTEWCEKENLDWKKINEADMPFIWRVANDSEFCEDFFRYEVYDWLYFISLFTDGDSSENYANRERYEMTSDDVRELLIKNNFGSFRMDW